MDASSFLSGLSVGIFCGVICGIITSIVFIDKIIISKKKGVE